MISTVLNLVLGVMSKIIAPLFIFFAGKNHEEKKQLEESLEFEENAKKIHHKLRTDSDYADHVDSVFNKDM